MDPLFETPERQSLRELTTDFTRQEIVPNLQRWEDEGALPRSLHRAAAAVGLLGIGYPEAVGGSGGDLVDMTVVTEALLESGASGGLFASLFSHGIAIPHILDAAEEHITASNWPAAEHLTDHWVTPVMNGEKIAALAVTEPDGGSDVAHLRTRAEKVDGGWLINGAKTYITSGVRADFVVVAARAFGPGAPGVALFVVERDNEGFSVSRSLEKMGWQCSDTAELAFVDCFVPDIACLTPQANGGFASLARHFATERLSLATIAYATALRSLTLSIEWCRSRTTFGEPLINRQSVRHDLVEMLSRTRLAQSFTRQCVASSSNSSDYLVNALIAKNSAVAACDYVVDRAVQLHGGLGYMRGTEVERHYRDAKILGIGGGATEVLTDLTAKLLGW